MREMNVEKEMRMNANIKRYVYVFLHIIMWGIVFAGPFLEEDARIFVGL